MSYIQDNEMLKPSTWPEHDIRVNFHSRTFDIDFIGHFSLGTV